MPKARRFYRHDSGSTANPNHTPPPFDIHKFKRAGVELNDLYDQLLEKRLKVDWKVVTNAGYSIKELDLHGKTLEQIESVFVNFYEQMHPKDRKWLYDSVIDLIFNEHFKQNKITSEGIKKILSKMKLITFLEKIEHENISVSWDLFERAGVTTKRLINEEIPIELVYNIFKFAPAELNRMGYSLRECNKIMDEVHQHQRHQQNQGWVPEGFNSQRVENYYDILGISQDATLDDIRRARKIIALKAHPDKGGDPKTMSKINEIVEILLNPLKRKEYDKKLKGQ